MTQKQYLAALKKLDLTIASKHTAHVLGLSVRQCQRFASGETAIPQTVERLLQMLVRHGVPVDWRDA